MDSQTTTNHLDIGQRIVSGQKKEEKILSLLSHHAIRIRGKRIVDWEHALKEEDMFDKIDAWAVLEDGSKLSTQVKYRDKGADVGVAVLMPFINHEVLLGQYEVDRLPWDRDMRSKADLMVCLSAGEKILSLAEMGLIKRAVNILLGHFVTTGYFNGRSFRHEDCPGAEFRVVTDQGEGYSYGKRKLVCYISPEILEDAGAFVYRYYDRPA